jgi:RNA polymerase sigma factor (sigma-70 family)
MTSDQWRIDAGTATLLKLAEELRGYFRRRVNNTGDAEDLVGQTWLAAGGNFEGRSSLRYYLYSVAQRLLSSYCSRKRYRPWIFLAREDPDTLMDDAPALDLELAREADMARFNRAVAQLPKHYAEVIELTLLGNGHVEIAKLLGINYNTVRSRYNRGKAQLLRSLDAGRRDT